MAPFGTHARAVLASRSGPHGGIPVGAVVLRPPHADGFRKLLERALGAPTRFRAVDRISAAAGEDDNPYGGGGGLLCLHLPVEAALLLEAILPPSAPAGDRAGAHPSVAVSSASSLNGPGGVGKEASLVAFMEAHDARYYSGVRVQEPLFGRGLPLGLLAGHVRDTASPRAAAADEDGAAAAPRFTFAEVFAGIGGFRVGLEGLGGRCVWASEINPFAARTYRTNFCRGGGSGGGGGGGDGGEEGSYADDVVVGDISEYPSEVLPRCDVLTAGFPCQPFSARGQQPGLGSLHKGQLYRELVRLLMAHAPRAFLFENVPGLVTMDGGHRLQDSGTGGSGAGGGDAGSGGGDGGSGSGGGGDYGGSGGADGGDGVGYGDGDGDGDGGADNASSPSAGSSSAASPTATFGPRSAADTSRGGGGGGGWKRWACHEPGSFTPGASFATVLAAFAGCGYQVSWRVINSQHWVPQFRERVYIVGVRREPGTAVGDTGGDGEGAAMDWGRVMSGKAAVRVLRDVLETAVDMSGSCDGAAALRLSELSSDQWESAKRAHHKRVVQVAARVGAAAAATAAAAAAAAATAAASTAADAAAAADAAPRGATAAEFHAVPPSPPSPEIPPPPLPPPPPPLPLPWGEGVCDPPAWWRSVSLSPGAPVPTLTSSYHAELRRGFTTKLVLAEHGGALRDGSAAAEGRLPRLLTPRECARCMGFPEAFRIPGECDPDPRQGRVHFYSQAGNAVCPPVIAAVAAELLVAAGL